MNKPIRALTGWAFLILGIVFFSQSIWIQAKAVTAQVLIKQSWHDTLTNKTASPPWPWADTWPVARLVFPNHNRDLYALAGSHGSALAFGPGHLDGTRLPEEIGTKVFSAHRDTHFSFFEELALGDKVMMQNRNKDWSEYQISNTVVINSEKETFELDLSEEKLVLITCYPFNAIDAGGPLRFVATAKKVETELTANLVEQKVYHF